jgi:hypothetical protein
LSNQSTDKNGKNILSHRISYDQYGNPSANRNKNGNNQLGSTSQINTSYSNSQFQNNIGNAILSGNRIRESSSGALVGKNIAGINSNMQKSTSNILSEDKHALKTKSSDTKQKYVTHESSNSMSKSQIPRNNLAIHRITSQQDNKANHQQMLQEQLKEQRE